MNNQTDKATARPWRTEHCEYAIKIVTNDYAVDFRKAEQIGEVICEIRLNASLKNRNVGRKANAALIVTAVNEHAALRSLAYAVGRVAELTKENYPHRSPEWVYDHPDTPIKLAMNNMLAAMDKALAAIRKGVA